MTRVVVALFLAGCSGARSPWVSSPSVDSDGDGWAPSDGDCDDADRDVFPGAPEAPGDFVDQDCDGIDAAAAPVSALAPGELRVVEIQPAPFTLVEALGEWVELQNLADFDVDLEGLLLDDLANDDFRVYRSVVVPAGGRVVLGGSLALEDNGGAPIALSWGGDLSLSDDADAVRLSVDGAVLDELVWDAGFPHADGVAAQLDLDTGAWCLAETVYGFGGRGTPGEANGACPPPFEGPGVEALEPGDLVVSELMTDPEAVAGDFGEWFEVRVDRATPIDLRGLRVEDDAGGAFRVEESLPVGPGDHVVFGAFRDLAQNGGAAVDVEWRFEFGLPNGGGTVRLLAGPTLVDELVYAGDLRPPEGASLALDPDADAGENDTADRWCVSEAPYGDGDRGSPGEPNAECR